MHVEGIIFDLDGVLVTTDRFHFRAWKQTADALGVPFDEEVNRRLRGVSRMDSLEIILERYCGPALSQEEKTAIAEEKNRIYRQLLEQMSPADVSPAVRDTLCTLRNRGYRLAVGSSSKNAKTILNRTGLTDAFDAVSDGTNISRSKPDPEVFLKAADYLGLAPGRCAVVEDAMAGIDAACAAGMESIGMGDAAEYPRTGHPIRRFEELTDLFPSLKEEHDNG